MRVVGADGCPGGWIAVAYDTDTGSLTPCFHGTFQHLLDAYPDAAAIGVDIPIGLIEGVPRACDTAARRVLGKRHSSVFPAPDPRVLFEPSYEEAKAKLRRLTGKGISKQAFGIYPKVAEVNRVVTPALQGRVFEVHPEICFWALAGHPMRYAKKKPAGYEERRTLLSAAFGVPILSREQVRSAARPAGPDDLLDATVAAWTALRVAQGREERLPIEPLEDASGLRMEIVY